MHTRSEKIFLDNDIMIEPRIDHADKMFACLVEGAKYNHLEVPLC